MTTEEAMKFCEGYLPECDTKKFVLESLGKQMPKKMIDWHCGSCGYILSVWNYCPICGQKVDYNK